MTENTGAKKNRLSFIVICFGLLIASGVLCSHVHAGVTGTASVTGQVPFTVYNIMATEIGTSNATITWKTNADANSTVSYGNTTDYGSNSTDEVMGTSHTIRLYSLSSTRVYHYRVISTTIEGESSTSSDATFTTLGTTIEPLTINNITATEIGTNNATITWKTNIDANSTVEYGTTTSYGSTSTDGVMGTSHTIHLYNLSVHKEYHYRVISKTNNGTSATSSDANLTTLYPTATIVATANQGTTFTGTTTTTVAGVQQVSLNISTTIGTTSVSGNTITINNPGNGWSKLEYSGTNLINDGKNVSIDSVQSVTMQSDPVTADLGGDIGTITTQIDIALTQIVSGVSIQQNIIQGATTSVTNAFQLAATGSNLEVKSIAYTVEFQNTESLNANLGTAGVTLDLSVDHAWVVANAPDGDRNNIRILRFGNDGTKEVLNTQYTGSLGSNDNFRATSPHGLSVFGMTAVASGSSGGGGSSSSSSSNSGGGGSSSSSSSSSGGGGSSSSSSSSSGSSRSVGLSTAQQAVQAQQGPFDESAVTTTRSLSVAGLTATTGPAGIQTFRLDTLLAEKSGATISSHMSNVITISQPGFTLTVVTRDIPIKVNGVISDIIQSVRLRTAPAYAHTSIGTVSISLDTPLAAIPENAAITTTISESVNNDIQDAFRSAARSNNQQVEGIAYSVDIGKTNFVANGPAIVFLTISPEWVTNHGGTKSIGIAHLSDAGTSAILKSDYTGSDDEGNMVFQATSPDGLSTFSLISLTNLAGPAHIQGETQPPAPSYPSESPEEIIQNLAGGIGRFMANNIVLVIGGCVVLFAIGTGVILYNVRSSKKNNRNGKKGQ